MPQLRAGTCAIVGRPNVGKSTLLNRILGEKLAIVTPKPQTTRNRIMGIKNLPGRAQIVFVDTPGIHAGRGALNRYMVEQALAALEQVDVVVYMVEAPRPPDRFVLERLAPVRRPVLCVMNKIDLVKNKNDLLPRIEALAREMRFAEIIPLSATAGDGVDRVLDAVVARLPEAAPLYPEEMLTDVAERFLVAEFIREQVFLLARDEVPYSTAVTIENWQEKAPEPPHDGEPSAEERRADIFIDATIHVERDSQKTILVGRGGKVIKEIGTRARAEMMRLLGVPVHLKLFVRVDPDWSRSQGTLRRMGYE